MNVVVVGSGNWGSAIARIIGRNVLTHPTLFSPTVNMWTFEEDIDGRKLTEIINEEHENVKYLAGVKIGENVVAVADLKEACSGADILVFVTPHQFMPPLYKTIRAALLASKKGCIGVSLIKGIDFDSNGPVLISDAIAKNLGIDVSVLMGANVANDVATDIYCEATLGYNLKPSADILKTLFHTPNIFKVTPLKDRPGVEICGALKNIVAMSAGFCDGLGYGQSTKAAIIRIGLSEISRFSKLFFPNPFRDKTLFESCGVSDLIATCYGGRNRKCAEEFVRRKLDSESSEEDCSWSKIEADLLNGQSLQGILTCKEVYEVMKVKECLGDFPLFAKTYGICFEGVDVKEIVMLEKVVE